MLKDVTIHDKDWETYMEDPAVTAAQLAFAVRLKDSFDVSDSTKNAQGTSKAGPALCNSSTRIGSRGDGDAGAGSKGRHRGFGIGLCLRIQGFAKNAGAEFYRDVVKILRWNQHRKKKLSCLTVITEEKMWQPFLDAPMPCTSSI